MTTSLPALIANVLDESWLSERIGAPVRAARLRIKPETSVIISFVDKAGQPAGWARWLWPISYSKAAKTQQQLEKLGLGSVLVAAGGLLLQHGPWLADPRLARRMAEAELTQDSQLLRYNPLRRVVVRESDSVMRLEATSHPLGRNLDWFIAEQVPIPQRLDDGKRGGFARYRFTGVGDLATHPDVGGTRQAGAMLARLHAAEVPQELLTTLTGRAARPMRQGIVHAKVLTAVSPSLASRIRATVDLLRPAPSAQPVLSHGDMSPDQVLCGKDQVWLTDFDRVCLAPRATDLGSYLAVVDRELGQAFLEGYREAGGRVPPEAVLRAATADSLMLRLADPLRLARVNWQDEIEALLQRIRELVS